MRTNAILIGNSDGIGLAITRQLLQQGWQVEGISRSKSTLIDPAYRHTIADVSDENYPGILASILETSGPPDLCIYCAGIGELFDPAHMENDVKTLEVNLLGMLKTAAVVIPAMIRKGNGHFIGISSVADDLLSPEAPAYHASKAGFSNYLEGLALALRSTNVHISNVRFGFVDTKLAKGDVKPFMISAEQAVRHLLICMDKKPVRYTAPRIVIPLVKFRKWMMRLQIFAQGTLLKGRRG